METAYLELKSTILGRRVLRARWRRLPAPARESWTPRWLWAGDWPRTLFRGKKYEFSSGSAPVILIG